MNNNAHYATVSEAIQKLKEQGFTIDFNVEGDCLISHSDKLSAEDFEIVDVYRYEGNTDPADEAVVYAIQSNTGLKGILVTSYGMYSDIESTTILSKLTMKQ